MIEYFPATKEPLLVLWNGKNGLHSLGFINSVQILMDPSCNIEFTPADSYQPTLDSSQTHRSFKGHGHIWGNGFFWKMRKNARHDTGPYQKWMDEWKSRITV